MLAIRISRRTANVKPNTHLSLCYVTEIPAMPDEVMCAPPAQARPATVTTSQPSFSIGCCGLPTHLGREEGCVFKVTRLNVLHKLEPNKHHAALYSIADSTPEHAIEDASQPGWHRLHFTQLR